MKSPDSVTVYLIENIDQGDHHPIGFREAIVPPSEFKECEITLDAHDVLPGKNRIGFDLGTNRGRALEKVIVILKK